MLSIRNCTYSFTNKLYLNSYEFNRYPIIPHWICILKLCQWFSWSKQPYWWFNFIQSTGLSMLLCPIFLPEDFGTIVCNLRRLLLLQNTKTENISHVLVMELVVYYIYRAREGEFPQATLIPINFFVDHNVTPWKLKACCLLRGRKKCFPKTKKNYCSLLQINVSNGTQLEPFLCSLY